MSEEISALRQRLMAYRYSRTKGFRVIVAHSISLGPPLITYEWLSRFFLGKIPSPGFERVERLKAVLDSLDALDAADGDGTPK